MRTFNPEKELRKIQRGNKNKVILFVISLLVVGVIGYSFALYQIRYNKQIIYTTVEPFYSKDLQLAVYVNGVKQDEFPEKSEDMLYGGYECERDSKINFDTDKWEVALYTNHPDKCSLRFGTKYEDKSGANYPELYQGMIPVYFKEGKIYIADITSEWYNYDNNEWANAVLIDYENNKSKFYDDNGNLLGGHEVKEEDILQMYVWIPRYKYQLWNVNNEGKPKQLINIDFETGTANTGDIMCTYTDKLDGTVEEKCLKKGTQEVVQNNDWYTHPAFTFGDTELKGIWVGKFEPSDPTDENGRLYNQINEIAILPNKTSMVHKFISTAFTAEQKLTDAGNKYNLNTEEVDTRVMKNSEWGAVTYLTQSVYGIYKDKNTCNIEEMDLATCEVWINNTAQGTGPTGTYSYGGTYTGCVGDSVSDQVSWNTEENTPAKCKEGNRWNEKGINASTTGNMYGVYDMSGGTWEFVMGATVNEKDGFKAMVLSESKYYDMYTYSENYLTHERGHLGDATRETLQIYGNDIGGWNVDCAHFPSVTSNLALPWFIRGGKYNDSAYMGIFAFERATGIADPEKSFRSVLSAA